MKKHRPAPKLIDSKRISKIMGFKDSGGVHVLSQRDPEFPKPSGKFTAKNGRTAYLYDESKILDYRKNRKMKRRKKNSEDPQEQQPTGREIDLKMAQAFIFRRSAT